jgi:hypothetical protein
MKSIASKKNFPLITFLVIMASGYYYYSSTSWINGFGSEKGEWMLLIDTFITIPLVCFYCFWKDKKLASIKTFAFIASLILLGSYVIPQAQKHLWLYLENLRYILIFGFLAFEIISVYTVAIAINASLKLNMDPDDAIKKPLDKLLGQSSLSRLMQIETRVWTFLLLAKRIKTENYNGIKHFSYHLKDGAESFLLGFIIITLFEIPLMHLLLHFIWSPYAATIVTLLTLLSLIYMLAEYKSIKKRPISLTDNALIIRYGFLNPLHIDLDEIEAVQINKETILRSQSHKRFNLFGVPNIEIQLKDSNKRKYHAIYLGLDSPDVFITIIKDQIKLNTYRLNDVC